VLQRSNFSYNEYTKSLLLSLQKQNNISLLIDLLEKTDFYARLYTLQLLAAITENRPERTRECIFTAPLGITRLVSILDDNRDIIRNGQSHSRTSYMH